MLPIQEIWDSLELREGDDKAGIRTAFLGVARLAFAADLACHEDCSTDCNGKKLLNEIESLGKDND